MKILDEWRRYYEDEGDDGGNEDEDEIEDEESDEEETSEDGSERKRDGEQNSEIEHSSKPMPITISVEPTTKNSTEKKDEIDSLSSTCDSNEGVKEMAYPEDEEFKTTEWIDRYEDSHPFDDTLNIDLDNDLVGVSVDNLFRGPPTEQEREYTGNEGVNLENWYHSALLVISTERRFLPSFIQRGSIESYYISFESAK